MLDVILNIAAEIDGILWGWWTKAFIAGIALFLTVKSGFFQFKKSPFILKNTLGTVFSSTRERSAGKMTPLQATSTALASTVGMGNIAGVATALSVGGPGAIFWMWVLALLGMITKTVEITLAVHYRETDTQGNIRGGPMYYIKKGLGWTFLAKLFSLGVFINAVITATLLQSHTVGRAFLSSYGINPYLTTAIMSILTAFVIIGGIQRIGWVCERLVPLMSILYICGGIVLFLVNFQKIPEVFNAIFRYAFAPAPAFGGFAGATVAAALKMGMARGMLSNEAGLGTAPMVHATADTPHPFRQGIWGAVEVFIDTIVICTITSFAVLSTGVLSNGESGIDMVIQAFSSVLPTGVSGAFISFAILSFCLSTQIGFFIYYRTAGEDVFGRNAMKFLKWFYLLPGIVFAGVADVDKIWVFANISVGVCSIPNLIAILALNGVFFVLMKDSLSGKNAYASRIVDSEKTYVRKAGKG
ncbi:alanine/glycine:cation symporter family protein [Acidobacteriota bacterium]